MAARLEVLGHLMIERDDAGPLRIECRGDVIVLDFPDLHTALALGRRMSRSRRRAGLQRVREGLARAGLALEISIAGRRVGRLAAETRPGWLAGWLGLAPLKLRFGPALGILLRGSAKPGSSKEGRENRPLGPPPAAKGRPPVETGDGDATRAG